MADTTVKLDFKEILRIGGILCLICAAVALILSFVNIITAERIAENEEMEKRAAMISLFGSESIEYTALEKESDSVDEIFSVTDKGNDLGYCVSLTPVGFGGEIGMMVAIGNDGKVIGTRIVSHSETPGLGSRIEGIDFLSQFVGASSVASNYDVLAGSTVSSKAVMAGVNDAIEAVSGIFGGGVAN